MSDDARTTVFAFTSYTQLRLCTFLAVLPDNGSVSLAQTKQTSSTHVLRMCTFSNNNPLARLSQ